MSSDGNPPVSPYGPADHSGTPVEPAAPATPESELPGYQPPPAAPRVFQPGPIDPTAGTGWTTPVAPPNPYQVTSAPTPYPPQQPRPVAPYQPVTAYQPVGPYSGYPGAAPTPGYPTPAGYPGYPGAWAPPPPYDGVAIAAISTAGGALVGGFVFTLLLIGAPVGLGLGIWSLNRIKRSGAQGKGLAITGIVLGSVGTALLILGIVFIGLLLAAFSNYSY